MAAVKCLRILRKSLSRRDRRKAAPEPQHDAQATAQAAAAFAARARHRLSQAA